MRYPLEPLLELAGTRSQLAEAVHMDPRNLARLAADGLTDRMADRLACMVGLHPSMLWPTWFDDGLTVTDFDFVNRGGWRHAWEWEHGYVTTNACSVDYAGGRNTTVGAAL